MKTSTQASAELAHVVRLEMDVQGAVWFFADASPTGLSTAPGGGNRA